MDQNPPEEDMNYVSPDAELRRRYSRMQAHWDSMTDVERVAYIRTRPRVIDIDLQKRIQSAQEQWDAMTNDERGELIERNKIDLDQWLDDESSDDI